MSSDNPYAPIDQSNSQGHIVSKVSVKPIELLKRSYAIIADQYWLFLGIVVIAMIIGSAVPFGLLMGPMVVGIFLCFAQRERGEKVELQMLFRGFDYFIESLIAFMCILAISLLLMLPLVAVFLGVMLWPILSADPNSPSGPPSIVFSLSMVLAYIMILVVNILVTLPFIFTFPLIADRKMKAFEAIKLSVRGVVCNLYGLLWGMLVISIISAIATIACYLPAILLSPITVGALFVLYRDIYGFLPDAVPTSPSQ